MSNWLRNFGAARQSAYFKQEQEADLQRHRKRLLLGEGRIEAIAGAGLGPRRERTFEESMRAFEVQPEILQQMARIDDPDAARRKEVVKRIRGAPAELTDAERLRYSSVVYGLAASLNLPKASLGRDRFHAAAQPINAAAARQRPLTPLAQAAETGRFAAAVRSMAYGSAAGLAGVALLAAVAYRYAGPQETQEASWKETWREGMLEAGRPWAEAARARMGVSDLPENARQPADPADLLGESGGEFTRLLSTRLRRSVGLPPDKPPRSVIEQAQLRHEEASLEARLQDTAGGSVQ